MALFCTAINQVLIDFCKGQFNADLWVRVRGAIEFLSYYPERNPKQRKGKGLDLPTYGFRDEKHMLTYEQLVATQRYLEKEIKRLVQTKKELSLLLNLRVDIEKRKAAARYCIELFYGLCSQYHYYLKQPTNFGLPRGIEKLCRKIGE